MIVHLVAWKYREDTDRESREEHVEKLRALPGKIADIVSFDVGSDILALERSYDTGLVARFRDRAGLDAYSENPEHVKVADLGKRIAENVVSVDFVVE